MIKAYKLIQDGIIVASTCGEKDFALDEIMRYAIQYEEDGPVEVVETIYESSEE